MGHIMRNFKRLFFPEKLIWSKLIAVVVIITLLALQKPNIIKAIVSQDNVLPPDDTGEPLREKGIDFDSMPVDLVYTWVNGTDPRFIEELKRPEGLSVNRFADKQQLRYSLRSLELYLPWIRHIYIVTNGQIPGWLNLSNPRISVVPHSDIYSNKTHLPTFNSVSIESHIHQIPGISKHFLYLNDDFFFNSPVWLSDFYTIDKGQKIYKAHRPPDCKPGCSANLISNGVCDKSCNLAECGFDGGDCKPKKPLQADSTCAPGCPIIWLSDRSCDAECNNELCGMDGGDCGLPSLQKTMFGVDYNPTTLLNYTDIRPPLGTKSMYINMANFMRYPNAIILDAFHDNPQAIRHSTVYQHNHLIILLFNDNIVCQSVNLLIRVGSNGLLLSNDASMIVVAIHVQTANVSVSEPTYITTMCEGLQDEPVKRNLTPAFIQTELSFSLIREMEKKKGSLFVKERNEKPRCLNLTDFPANVIKILNIVFKSVQDGSTAYDEYKEIENFMIKHHGGSVCHDKNTIKAREGGVIMDAQQFKEQYKIGDFTGQRKLLDKYAESMNYVDRVFTRKYGWARRDSIQHMPHFIDRDIMTELQSEFPEEYEATSSHYTRDAHDMQFAFAYMAYIMEKRPARPIHMLWEEIDTDRSGDLSKDEIQVLADRIYDRGDDAKLKILKTNLEYCARGPTEAHKDNYPPNSSSKITQDVFGSCPFIVEKTWQKVNSYRKYKHEIMYANNVHFSMIADNLEYNEREFNIIRRKERKFVCINDDIDANSPKYDQ
eukprot:Ihof_evm2s103 gene=Ihof_evmTU2s103